MQTFFYNDCGVPHMAPQKFNRFIPEIYQHAWPHVLLICLLCFTIYIPYFIFVGNCYPISMLSSISIFFTESERHTCKELNLKGLDTCLSFVLEHELKWHLKLAGLSNGSKCKRRLGQGSSIINWTVFLQFSLKHCDNKSTHIGPNFNKGKHSKYSKKH